MLPEKLSPIPVTLPIDHQRTCRERELNEKLPSTLRTQLMDHNCGGPLPVVVFVPFCTKLWGFVLPRINDLPSPPLPPVIGTRSGCEVAYFAPDVESTLEFNGVMAADQTAIAYLMDGSERCWQGVKSGCFNPGGRFF